MTRHLPTTPRLLALTFGSTLLGTYLREFYRVVDVVGGDSWFLLCVGGALVLATVAAGRGRTSHVGSLLGGLLFVVGIAVYLLSVPSLLGELLTVGFVVRWLSYLTGLTVLQFERADVWAIAVAPGPAFLSWYLLLRRRYAAAGLVGGLMVAFFASTGDAGATATLVGMTCLLGLLGVGQFERNPGAVREVVRLGIVLALAAVVARTVRVVPRSGGGSTTTGSGGSGGAGGRSLAGDMDQVGDEAAIHERISLSPRAYFTVDADRPGAWRVAAYDRYSGDDWVRTGESAPYSGPLPSPPGDSTRLEQSIEVQRSVRTLPATWKPIEVEGLEADEVRVSDLADLTTTRELEAGEQFRVTSAVPDVDIEGLREAGDGYPEAVLDRYRQLPGSTSDRVGRLAEQITAEVATDYDAAMAISQWLVREKDYDTAVERPPGDVAESFLFSMDRGYCVYFATAMAVLLRAIDVPARFVLGYTTGQPVGTERWVVRGFDSHAWVEVYFPGHGWVGFDPTPSTPRRNRRVGVLESARQQGVPGIDTEGSIDVSARRVDTDVDSIGRNVTVAANSTALTNANGSPAGASTGGNASMFGREEQEDVAAGDPSDGVVGTVETWIAGRDRIALLAGAAGLGLGLHWIDAFDRGLQAVQLRWQRPTGSPQRDVERAYRRFELLLARRYRDRSPGETPRRYFAAAGFRDVGRARRLIDLYERATYGDGVTRAEADEAIRIVDSLVDGTG